MNKTPNTTNIILQKNCEPICLKNTKYNIFFFFLLKNVNKFAEKTPNRAIIFFTKNYELICCFFIHVLLTFFLK